MELEFRLNGGGLDQRYAFLRPAHRPRVNILKAPVHSECKEEVVGMAKLVESQSKMA